MDQNRQKLATEPYKGVRDFYPEDERVQEYIFGVMRRVVESFGYQSYSASVLESTELYRAKSGEELVSEQMYVFEDRGGREVALRPEMTPSLARMVAARRRELSLPLRWYTIANMFRYERPQRGRLREHWQLNVDMFGADSAVADAEIIAIAHQILLGFGLTQEQFEIRVNHCDSFTNVLAELGLPEERQPAVRRVTDRVHKLPKEEFEKQMIEAVGDESMSKKLIDRLNTNVGKELLALSPVKELYDALAMFGIFNNDVVYDWKLVRGFDYYTGMVFEVYDKNPNNNRSLFGGGRYDNLLDIFGAEKVPAVGFGMGDVTIHDVLETYDLLPKDLGLSATQLYICTIDEKFFADATALAGRLRTAGLRLAVDYSGRKIGDQIKKAAKDGIRYILCYGEEEAKTGQYRVKELATGKEIVSQDTELVDILSQKNKAA